MTLCLHAVNFPLQRPESSLVHSRSCFVLSFPSNNHEWESFWWVCVCGWMQAHLSGYADGQWGHPSCDRRSCTGDTWRVSPLNAAWCDAAGYPSGWKRRRTGCTGTGVRLRKTAHREQTPLNAKRQGDTVKTEQTWERKKKCITGAQFICIYLIDSFYLLYLISLIWLRLMKQTCVDAKAGGCRIGERGGSLIYKRAGRQNKLDDGASRGPTAIQQPVGGLHGGATLHLSVLPLPHRLLVLWSNKSLSDSACQLRNAPLPGSIWSENLIFSSSFVSKIRAPHHDANAGLIWIKRRKHFVLRASLPDQRLWNKPISNLVAFYENVIIWLSFFLSLSKARHKIRVASEAAKI